MSDKTSENIIGAAACVLFNVFVLPLACVAYLAMCLWFAATEWRSKRSQSTL